MHQKFMPQLHHPPTALMSHAGYTGDGDNLSDPVTTHGRTPHISAPTSSDEVDYVAGSFDNSRVPQLKQHSGPVKEELIYLKPAAGEAPEVKMPDNPVTSLANSEHNIDEAQEKKSLSVLPSLSPIFQDSPDVLDEAGSYHNPQDWCVVAKSSIADIPELSMGYEKELSKPNSVADQSRIPTAARPNKEKNAPLADTVPSKSESTDTRINQVDSRTKHQQATSVFTEEEIKGRKQAWDRISLPLDPRKTIKPTPVGRVSLSTLIHNQVLTQSESVPNTATPSQPFLGDGDMVLSGSRVMVDREIATEKAKSRSDVCVSRNSSYVPEFPEGLSRLRDSAANAGDLLTLNLTFRGSKQGKKAQAVELSTDIDLQIAQTLSSPKKRVIDLEQAATRISETKVQPPSTGCGNLSDKQMHNIQQQSLDLAQAATSNLQTLDEMADGRNSSGKQPQATAAEPNTRNGKSKSGKNWKSWKSQGPNSVDQPPRVPNNQGKAMQGRTNADRVDVPTHPNEASGRQQAVVPSQPPSNQLSHSNTHPTPKKRPVEDVTKPVPSLTPKRSKKEGVPEGVEKLEETTQEPTEQTNQAQPHRNKQGLHQGYRGNAGGSLRMPKKRKGRPQGMSTTTLEMPLTQENDPPSSEFVFAFPAIPSTHGILKALDTQADPIKKSNLNPQAATFVSPSKATAVDAETSMRCPQQNAVSKTGLNAEVQFTQERGSKSSPLKASSQRATPAKRVNTDNPGRGTEPTPSKGGSKSNGGSKNKHSRARESKDLSAAPLSTPKRVAPRKKGALGISADDWPSLPVPRERAATMQTPPSRWRNGRGEHSPA